ncbi:MAG: hypothetical protein AABY10_04825 [Nanoarchaeota archaeon]
MAIGIHFDKGLARRIQFDRSESTAKTRVIIETPREYRVLGQTDYCRLVKEKGREFASIVPDGPRLILVESLGYAS